MADTLGPVEPNEAWIVEVAVLGREGEGPWRVQFDNTRLIAERHATEWNASRPAGYSHRVRRYVPEEQLAAAQRRVETIATETENHRVAYGQRVNIRTGDGTEEYWKGRRDEAGWCRDRLRELLAALAQEQP